MRANLISIETTAPTTDVEPISLEDAETHLSTSPDQRLELKRKLAAARNDAENWIRRTLRSTVTRTFRYRCWERSFAIPWPPLQSITSVKYYDLAETLQTLSSSDYDVIAPTEGVGRVEFSRTYDFPTLSDTRLNDRIEIIAVTGWGSRAAIPPNAVAAVEKLLWCLWEDDQDAAHVQRQKDARLLLDNLSYGFHA